VHGNLRGVIPQTPDGNLWGAIPQTPGRTIRKEVDALLVAKVRRLLMAGRTGNHR